MVRMTLNHRVRKPHRQEWARILNRLLPASVWQSLSAELSRVSDKRVRWSDKFVILCWMMMGWSMRPQLIERFHEGRETLGRLYPSRRRPGGSYQGLVKATQARGQNLWSQFAQCVRDTMPEQLKQCWKWYGWVVMAADGSRIRAPRTRANERKLGQSSKDNSYPQWWVTSVIHLPSRVIWDWRQGRGDSSERGHLREMIPNLPVNTMLLADIGFGGYSMLKDLDRLGICFLIRCGGNTTLLVEDTHQEIERRGECRYVYLWPQNHRKEPPLRLRLIVLKDHGKRVYLLTNVMDSTRLSRSVASDLYAARWGIEVNYRNLKQTMEHCNLLARDPEAGAMELAGDILALMLLMLHAFLAMGKRALRASVAAVLKIIRALMEALRYCQSTARLWAYMRGALMDEYKRHSSKKARDWPHKKRETTPGPPKMRRPTRAEKTCIDRVWGHAELGFS